MQNIIFLGSFILLVLGLSMFRSFKVKHPKENTFSILIACRNEAKNLPYLFDSLMNLNYPDNKFEIIIIDDFSADQSPTLLKEFQTRKNNIKCFYLREKNSEYKGKKAALKLAAEHAKYDFLAYTDADCYVHPEWLYSHNKFISKKVGFVIGRYEEKNISEFQRFCNEMSGLVFAATACLGFPFSAAGSNMVVRRESFEEVGGYKNIKHNLAGDDKQLLNLVKQTNWKVSYNPEILVSTQGIKEINREKRKYGKFKMSSLPYQLILVLIVMFFLFLIYYFFTSRDIIGFVVYYFSFVFLMIANKFKHRFKIKLFDFFYLIFYPYYVIFFSIWGTFSNWHWKDNHLHQTKAGT